MFQPAEALALASENPAKLRGGQVGVPVPRLVVCDVRSIFVQDDLLEVPVVAACLQDSEHG